jgi:hypothetical protein
MFLLREKNTYAVFSCVQINSFCHFACNRGYLVYVICNRISFHKTLFKLCIHIEDVQLFWTDLNYLYLEKNDACFSDLFQLMYF